MRRTVSRLAHLLISTLTNLLISTLAFLLISATLWAQAPQKMSYQAVIRNASNGLVVNQQVGMRITILQGSADGTAVYTETLTPTTNANGLVSVEVGGGGDFDAIDWTAGPYFLKTETDPAGGASYSITGVSQLLSVPYAQHARTSERVTGGIDEADPVFSAWDKSTGIAITESQVTDLGTYIEAETDPVFSAWDKSTGISITESQVTDLGTYIETETDPTVPSHVKSITTDNVSDWNEAHGWGDHSAEGYLTDYTVTETDVTTHQGALTVTESQISDLGTYIEAETDPIFTAWDKDYEDLTNKPDLTAFATTSDMNTSLDGKVDKEAGKDLQAAGTTPGEMQYWDGDQWLAVAPGETEEPLTFCYGVPMWGSCPVKVTLSTAAVTAITINSATSGGNITDDGGAAVTTRGVVWSTSESPTVEDNEGITTDGEGTGEFASELTGLTPSTTYYVRGYATNMAGIEYGQQESFETLEEVTGAVDEDGNVYATVIIGTQEWMAENLRVTTYRNGDAIPTGLSDTEWSETNDGAFAIYPHADIDGLNSDAEVLEAYGALYNWYAVDDARGLCPTGWHVPTDAEWTELVDYVVAQGYPNEWDNPNGAGNALKSCRQASSPLGGDCATDQHPRWLADATHHGTDVFGFSALPGGGRSHGGTFYRVGYDGHWWSSTEDSANYAWYRDMDYTLSNVHRYGNNKELGFSVRCLRDL